MSALWISALAEAAVRSTALLGIAALLTLFLRRRAATTRHLVWGCALAGVLVLPLTGAVLPGVPVPLPSALADALPEPWVATIADAPGPENAPRATSDAEARSGSSFGTAPVRTANDASEATRAGVSRSSTGSTGSSVAAVGATIAWAPVLLAVWAVGAAALGAWLLAGVRNTKRLAAEASEVVSPEWLDPARDIAAQLGIRRPVRVLQSERAVTPITWGWRRPVVVVPATAAGWSPERRAVVLKHELAHVRRGDVVTQLLARWVCTFYWFNPAVWFAAYRLRVERERACDDEVLRLGTRASDYANHLLDIARKCHAPGLRASAAVAMARRSQLEGRMRAILDPKARRERRAVVLKGARPRSVGVTTVLLTGTVLAAAAVKPTAQIDQQAAGPVAVDEQEPRTETDVVVALPQPVPAPTPEPRPPVQPPRTTTAVEETEPASGVATQQSERRPEAQRADEQGEEPADDSQETEATDREPDPLVAFTETTIADAGQETEAPDVAVEEQSLTLEKLHGEFTTEPRQRSEPAATRSGAATAITETEPASRVARQQSERRPEAQRADEQGEEPADGGQAMEGTDRERVVFDISGSLEEVYEELERVHNEIAEPIREQAEQMRQRADEMQREAEEMRQRAEENRRQGERAVANTLVMGLRALEVLPDDFDADVFRALVLPTRTPQAPEPPDQPEPTNPPTSTSPDRAGAPEPTDPPGAAPPPPPPSPSPPQAFPPAPPAPPPASPGEVPPAG